MLLVRYCLGSAVRALITNGAAVMLRDHLVERPTPPA
jgi:hypothetical protein